MDLCYETQDIKANLIEICALCSPVPHSEIAKTVHSNGVPQAISKIEASILFITEVGFIEHIREGKDWSIFVYITSPLLRKLWLPNRNSKYTPYSLVCRHRNEYSNATLRVFTVLINYSCFGCGWNQWKTDINSPQTWCIHWDDRSSEGISFCVLQTELWPRNCGHRWFSTVIQKTNHRI